MDEIDKLAPVLAKVFNQMVAPINERLDETEALISTHRFLLEMLYANQFIGDAAGLNNLMEGLLQRVRSAPTKSVPMQADDVIERQARIATHLQRFQKAVLHRVEHDQRDQDA